MRILEVGGQGLVGLDDPGPISRVVGELANQFANLGHDVTVADARSDGVRNEIGKGVRFFEVDLPCRRAIMYPRNRREKTRYRWLQRFYDAAFVRRLTTKLDLTQFDVIHTHIPTIGRRLARRYPDRVVHTSHTPLWANRHRYRAFRGKLRRIRQRIGRLLNTNELGCIHRSALNISLGDFQREALQFLAPVTAARVPQVVIPNGIDTARWQPVPRQRARQIAGIGNSEFIVVTVGRHVPVKGHLRMIEAVRSLAPRLPQLRAFIVGPPGLEEYEHMLAESSSGLPIEWIGYLEHGALVNLICAADVFLLSSEFDTQPTVVLESMALGVPVVATGVGGVPEMVTPDVGVVIESSSSDAIACALAQLAADPSLLARLRSACRQNVESRFNWPDVAQRYIDAFRRHVLPTQFSAAIASPDDPAARSDEATLPLRPLPSNESKSA